MTKQKTHSLTHIVFPILMFFIFSACQETLVELELNSKSKNNLERVDTKALHIVKATLVSVSKRISYWTIRIRFNDVAQLGTTYIKATIGNSDGTIEFERVMGRSIYYNGPIGYNVEIDYLVNYSLPCPFEENDFYTFRITYFDSDGSYIDGMNADDVFYLGAKFKCDTQEKDNG